MPRTEVFGTVLESGLSQTITAPQECSSRGTGLWPGEHFLPLSGKPTTRKTLMTTTTTSLIQTLIPFQAHHWQEQIIRERLQLVAVERVQSPRSRRKPILIL